MTPDEIRIAVAECCGWQQHKYNRAYCSCPSTPKGAAILWPTGLPNYPASLDACAEFEKTLTFNFNAEKNGSEWMDYLEWLGYCGENNTSELARLILATPLQRCEAFLRVKGKWRDAK